jgi:hypothetical protein
MGVNRHERSPRRTKTDTAPMPEVYIKPETHLFLRKQKAAVGGCDRLENQASSRVVAVSVSASG